jgi:hypothetical protein
LSSKLKIKPQNYPFPETLLLRAFRETIDFN